MIVMNQEEHLKSLGPEFLEFMELWSSLLKTVYIPRLSDYLDNVVPRLQPNVVVMDLSSPTQMRIRLAGTAVVDTVGEITNSDADDLYLPAVKSDALGQAWIAANHPCGYTVERVFRTTTGMSDSGSALLLPIKTTPDMKSVVIYNEVPAFGNAKLADDAVQTVIAYNDLKWIDIGAGTPD